MAKSKIILFDCETLPAITTTFTLYPTSIPHENILQDWSILCVCWKELEAGKVRSVSVLDDPKRFKKDVNDDYHVVKTIREVFEDADVIIGHNSKKFDTKKLNARLMFHGLPPLPSGLQQFDTLQELKKVANFTSHRLDYLGKHFFDQGKIETSRGLWLRSLKGDVDAIKEMVKYCKGDVELLEKLYLKIRPYAKSHPHVGAIEGWDKNHTCPKCGSDQLSVGRYRYTAAGIKKVQKQCNVCHSYSTFIFKPDEKPNS